jgi:hypothetical protein
VSRVALCSTPAGDRSSQKYVPAAATLLDNVLVPALICLEGSRAGSDTAPGELPLGVAAARRKWCFRALAVSSKRLPADTAVFEYSIPFACISGKTYEAGLDMFGLNVVAKRQAQGAPQRSSDLALLYVFYATIPPAEGEGQGKCRLRDDSFASDPFLGPIYRSRRCATCGVLPGRFTDPPFAFCSLCNDPAAGRFCSREPCFAAFWRGGHKKECKGKDKISDLIKKSG